MSAEGGARPAQPATERTARAVAAALRRHARAVGDGPLIVAVSGGADSMALLFALAACGVETEQPVVARFAHGLRPRADRTEAKMVRGAASSLGWAFEDGAGDAAAHAKRTGASVEEAARDLRYAFLAEMAARHSASAVLTAHTLDDQAETVLLRLTRGSGLRGAAGMREWSVRSAAGRPLRLLRPLLNVTRADTEAVCAEQGATPASDATNRSLRYARNRVRNRALPELARVNPDARRALARFAQAARADDDYLAQAAREAVRGAERRSPGKVEWRRAALAALPWPLFVRVVEAAWAHVRGGGAALSNAQLAAVRALADAGSEGGEAALSGGRFVVEQALCRLEALPAPGRAPASDGREPPPPALLAVPGTAQLGRWLIEARLGRPGAAPETASRWSAVVDAAALVGPAYVRTRRSGDRFQPLGMAQAARLQDVLVGARAPRGVRAELPLVDTYGGIAWVCGVRIAEWAKVTEATQRTVTLEARRLDGTRPQDAPGEAFGGW